MKETISLINWDKKDSELAGAERQILADWGLENYENSIQPHHKTLPIIQSFDCWNPPPTGFLKLNFDEASKGNPGKSGYGFILRNHKGNIISFGYGFLGIDSNNVAEIEGLIQGLEWVFENLHNPIITEGDS